MAALSKNVRTTLKVQNRSRRNIEPPLEVVEVTLRSELLRKAIAAANASGQTPGEWIRDALSEAIRRRIQKRRD